MTASLATGSAIDCDIYSFEPHLLTQVQDWARIDSFLGERNLHIRPLKFTDYKIGYKELISRMSSDKTLSDTEFEKRFNTWKACGDYPIVMIETSTKRLVGASNLSLELKFIHQCANRGRVEHFVISDDFKYQNDIIESFVKILVGLAKEPYNCYKLTLDCTDDMREFYAKNGFSYGSNMLEANFDSTATFASAYLSSDDAYLFDKMKLAQLSKWPEIDEALQKGNLLARPLTLSDYENGYLELLSQLTAVGNVTKVEFEKQFRQMQSKNQIECRYAIVIIEDMNTKKVVGASTLFMNYTSIEKYSFRGRLEDVAVLDTYRGKNIGLLVVKIIFELAREAFKCSKLSLDCTDDLKKFYAKNGFTYGY